LSLLLSYSNKVFRLWLGGASAALRRAGFALRKTVSRRRLPNTNLPSKRAACRLFCVVKLWSKCNGGLEEVFLILAVSGSGPVLVAGKIKAPNVLTPSGAALPFGRRALWQSCSTSACCRYPTTTGGFIVKSNFGLFNDGGAVEKIWFPSPDPILPQSRSLKAPCWLYGSAGRLLNRVARCSVAQFWRASDNQI
jgi:hypothetical protein